MTPWTVASQAPLSIGITQTRILGWVAISFFRGSSQIRDRTHISCIGRWILYHWATRETMFNLSLVKFSHSVMSDSLQPHRLQHTRLLCPSPTPGAYSNSCPSSPWCHPTISSLLSSPSPPAFNLSQDQGLFQWVSSSHQVAKESIAVSTSASVLPMNIQDWFPLGLTGVTSLQSKGFSRVFLSTTIQKYQFFSAQLSL